MWVPPNAGRDGPDGRRAPLLRFTGSWTHKVPKDEAEYRQQENDHGPQYFLARVRAALEDVDNRPYIRDQNDQSHYSLILHIAPSTGF
jgi:hypothetical protein